MNIHLLLTLILQRTHRPRQYPIILRLTPTRWTHNHQSMSHLRRIIQLYNFCYKRPVWLQISLPNFSIYLFQQFSVIYNRLFKARKKVLNNILEQRQVVFEEFRDIYISEGPEEELFFVHIGVLRFELSGGVDHGSNSSHTIIVVVLGGKLFRRKFEGSDHFFGQISTGKETEGVQD